MYKKAFESKFLSVADSATSISGDKEQILDAMISTFGSIDETDRYLRDLVKSKLSDYAR